MRRICVLLMGLCIAPATWGATVTYTLRLHESAAGAKVATNQFVVYATAEPGTTNGIAALSLDLEGALSALNLRPPGGYYAMDDTSPSWDSTVNYPTPFFV